MVGLDAAGKTTILYKLKLGEIVTTIPTIGTPLPPSSTRASLYSPGSPSSRRLMPDTVRGGCYRGGTRGWGGGRRWPGARLQGGRRAFPVATARQRQVGSGHPSCLAHSPRATPPRSTPQPPRASVLQC